MENDNGFKWDDKLVEEILKHTTAYDAHEHWKLEIEQFKKSKEPKNKPLFITEDGVDYYLSDTRDWYEVTPQTIGVYKSNLRTDSPFQNRLNKKFSTKELAEEYIIFNKPLLSLNDLLDVWDDKRRIELYKTAPLFLKFKEVAEQKINQ